jgi:hypothetical protein
MITLRAPEDVHRTTVDIVNGKCNAYWHFSFADYFDPERQHFGTLRVFNDDTLDPGAVWPLHPHREIEVVTYVADGEFMHEDENGRGEVLKEGWVQHTTVGRGMHHAELNNRDDAPMRFIQIWIMPQTKGLDPYYDIKKVEPAERTDRWLALVSNHDEGALPIAQDARVLSCRLTGDKTVRHQVPAGRGAYLLVLKGGPLRIGGARLPAHGAAQVEGPEELSLGAEEPTELLMVDVAL